MLESKFKQKLVKVLKKLFPGCIVLVTDERYLQGFPDLVILYNNKWVVLETKNKDYIRYQPNQQYYIDLCNKMSYCSQVNENNVDEVLYEIQKIFES